MIRKLHPKQYSQVESLLLHMFDAASLEWLYHFETARDKIVAYSSKNLKDGMLIFGEINVLILTDSQAILEGFLNKLDTEKGYGFRCLEWMAPIIMEKFPPKEADYKGIVLLTYSCSEDEFVKYTDAQYVVRVLSEDDANEVTTYSRHHWSPDFIRERIKKGLFYGIYQANELISWLGTIWESKRACEIGFAFTKEKHRGRGLMKILTSVVTEKTLQNRKIPIFHTAETNIPAIRVAESLGYDLRAREWAYFYNL
jgi:predicted GNAT family acetyltransferase